MTSKIEVEINRRGVGDVMKDSGLLADLQRRADRIAAAAGPGHVVVAEIGRTRARASIITATPAAKAREAKDHRLLRALDAGR